MASTSRSIPPPPGNRAPTFDSKCLWRECVHWLIHCKVIPRDHKANWPNSEIRVLAMALRDGVLLCQLLMKLDPSCLKFSDFNRHPQMAQFLCCKNIKLFLSIAKTKFRLKEADLFEVSMLYDLKNFHKVLLTLAKLSHCAKTKELRPELPLMNIDISGPLPRPRSSDSLYDTLEPDDENSCFSDATLKTDKFENFSLNDTVVSFAGEIASQNCTENTAEYHDDISGICETFIDELPSVLSESSDFTAAFSLESIENEEIMDLSNKVFVKPPTRQAFHGRINKKSVMSVGGNFLANIRNNIVMSNYQSGSMVVVGNIGRRSKSPIDPHNLRTVGAYNYAMTTDEMGPEYLNDIEYEQDEKIYEDLCYVTISSSSSVSEV